MVTDHILTSLFLISRIIVFSKPEFGNFRTVTLKSSSLPVRFYNVRRYWPVERSGVVRLKGTGLKHLRHNKAKRNRYTARNLDGRNLHQISSLFFYSEGLHISGARCFPSTV